MKFSPSDYYYNIVPSFWFNQEDAVIVVTSKAWFDKHGELCLVDMPSVETYLATHGIYRLQECTFESTMDSETVISLLDQLGFIRNQRIQFL